MTIKILFFLVFLTIITGCSLPDNNLTNKKSKNPVISLIKSPEISEIPEIPEIIINFSGENVILKKNDVIKIMKYINDLSELKPSKKKQCIKEELSFKYLNSIADISPKSNKQSNNDELIDDELVVISKNEFNFLLELIVNFKKSLQPKLVRCYNT